MGSQRVRHDLATDYKHKWVDARRILRFVIEEALIASKRILLEILILKVLFERFLPGGSDGKQSACNIRYPSSIRGSGRSPAEGDGNPLQYSGLENSMGCIVHGVAKSQT